MAWVLGLVIWGLSLASCTHAPTRPVLGAFTGDEREMTYLDQGEGATRLPSRPRRPSTMPYPSIAT